jgi:hypothetical protein
VSDQEVEVAAFPEAERVSLDEKGFTIAWDMPLSDEQMAAVAARLLELACVASIESYTSYWLWVNLKEGVMGEGLREATAAIIAIVHPRNVIALPQ